MNITKDEARILAAALEIAKFEFSSLSFGFFDSLSDLETRLEEYGKDKRRNGRASMDDFSDCIKRFAKSNRKKLN
jgi:hypothetical protein